MKVHKCLVVALLFTCVCSGLAAQETATPPANPNGGRATVDNGLPPASTRSGSIPDSLHRYVSRAEPDFGWKHEETRQIGDRTIQRLELTSQRWQEGVWKHALYVYEPTTLSHPRHMMLFVTGGRNGRLPSLPDMVIGLRLADLCGARIATLHQVPNQPLLEDRVEDDLLAETCLRYLATGDETWPLLLPMVKSAVKAMDALEEFARQQEYEKIEGFVIAGASKRGWTSWLTPAVDRRIIATAPIVIDVLNFPAQMKHQLDTWGKYSEQIDDYTRRGLDKILQNSDDPRETRLREVLDPYTYRYLVRIPKLLVVGTNDRYWTVDAMGLYFDDLVGPKHVLVCPNVGHNLGDRKDFAMTTLGAFVRHAARGQSLPKLEWSVRRDEAELRLTATSDVKPRSVRHWTANSGTKDFRESTWSSQAVKFENGAAAAAVPKSAGRHAATFLEFVYEADELTYSLTTRIYRD